MRGLFRGDVIKFQRFIRNISSSVIDIAPEIRASLNENRPIVALESTIITHGMPYPSNLETAVACGNAVRKEGCVPAIIAVLKGRIKVGLQEDELNYLAEGGSGNTIKTSRRDFPFVLGNKLDGGTTVSGTTVVANTVGIKVFATGGIGGVHRRGEETLDISADLVELGKNPIMVVSSGIKSILDIGKTLEYLETQGVLVATFGPNRCMPAFFSRNSSFIAPYNVMSCMEAASLIKGTVDMNLKSGILLAVPIPEEYSIDYNLMESYINDALFEADNKEIRGKEITPFLLDKINSITEGKSLESNIALVTNNSKVAAKIALYYSDMCNTSRRNFTIPQVKVEKKTPVVIGGSVVDCVVSLNNGVKFNGQTVKANMGQWCGGVGRNIADALGKLGNQCSFISAVGPDQNGKTILNSLSHIDSKSVEVLENEKTASYMVLVDHKGECLICAGNSDIHEKTDSDQIKRYLNKIDKSNFLIFDSNIPQDAMEFIISYGSKSLVPLWVEPTSLLKCHKVLSCDSVNSINFISPNLLELKQMAGVFGTNLGEDFNMDDIDKLLKQVLFLSELLTQKINALLMITMGKHGILMANRNLANRKFIANFYPALNTTGIVNSSGAGDCSAAGFITGLLLNLPEAKCITLANIASSASLLSYSPVPDYFALSNSDLDSANFISVSV